MSDLRPPRRAFVPGFRPRLGAPLAFQIIGLLVVVLIIGQVATLAVVMVLPPPRPPVYRIEEVASALKGERTLPRYGPALIRSNAAAPPAERPGRDFRVMSLKSELARLLAVPEERVRLVMEPRPNVGFPFGAMPRRRGSANDRMGMMGPPDAPPPGSPPPGSPPSDRSPDAPPPAADSPPPGPPSPGFDGGDHPPPWSPYARHGWFGFRRGSNADHGVIVGGVQAAYQTSSGPWITVHSPTEGFPNAWQRRMLLWFLACIAVLTPVGYLFARRITAPIVRFSAAADRLGRGLRSTPITLRGPAEIGVAAAAFNEMQARLARYVEDRTAMIGAIAHDLRTPLARVQFKLQRAPADLAADIRADLGQMEAMIAAVLAFVRDAAPTHEREPLDLLSLLEVVADDASATGADVEIEPGESLIVEGDASALQRLFVNLVDNALKYGGSARLRLHASAGEAVVEIADNGPGLSEADHERVFEPFYRVETSRSRDTGGIGLGLSIARSIARAHGGDVTLSSEGAGLTAIVRLPVAKTAR